MSGQLHVHNLVFHFFHQRLGIDLGGNFLQIDYLESTGNLPMVVKTEIDLSKGSFS